MCWPCGKKPKSWVSAFGSVSVQRVLPFGEMLLRSKTENQQERKTTFLCYIYGDRKMAYEELCVSLGALCNKNILFINSQMVKLNPNFSRFNIDDMFCSHNLATRLFWERTSICKHAVPGSHILYDLHWICFNRASVCVKLCLMTVSV